MGPQEASSGAVGASRGPLGARSSEPGGASERSRGSRSEGESRGAAAQMRRRYPARDGRRDARERLAKALGRGCPGVNTLLAKRIAASGTIAIEDSKRCDRPPRAFELAFIRLVRTATTPCGAEEAVRRRTLCGACEELVRRGTTRARARGTLCGTADSVRPGAPTPGRDGAAPRPRGLLPQRLPRRWRRGSGRTRSTSLSSISSGAWLEGRCPWR